MCNINLWQSTQSIRRWSRASHTYSKFTHAVVFKHLEHLKHIPSSSTMSVYVKKTWHVHNQCKAFYVDLEHHTHIASSHIPVFSKKKPPNILATWIREQAAVSYFQCWKCVVSMLYWCMRFVFCKRGLFFWNGADGSARIVNVDFSTCAIEI